MAVPNFGLGIWDVGFGICLYKRGVCVHTWRDLAGGCTSARRVCTHMAWLAAVVQAQRVCTHMAWLAAVVQAVCVCTHMAGFGGRLYKRGVCVHTWHGWQRLYKRGVCVHTWRDWRRLYKRAACVYTHGMVGGRFVQARRVCTHMAWLAAVASGAPHAPSPYGQPLNGRLPRLAAP